MKHVDSPFKSPVILSLCPGIRGLERGVERTLGKLRVAAYVEIEAFIIANLLAGMEAGLLDAAPIWSNLKTFDAKPFYGKIHGILGGYPCQPFSAAGQRRGETDPRHLYPFISRCIKKSRPVWCFFENVEGHLSLGFQSVQKDLRKLGYSVEAGIYSAAEVGAPHRRDRLFILAVENSYLQRMRRRNDVEGPNRRCEVQVERSSELADTRHNRHGSNSECGVEREQKEGPEELSSSDKVENAKSIGLGPQWAESAGLKRSTIINNAGTSSETMGHTDNQQGNQIIGGIRRESGATNESMGHSNDSRLQGRLIRKCEESSCQWSAGSNGPFDPADRWPARPGEQQHEWEEPRIIKPGMGCSVNGYNFREDFLRALGNSVVEQTAELAFRDLSRKHGITL